MVFMFDSVACWGWMNFSPGVASLEGIQHFGLKSFEVEAACGYAQVPKVQQNPT